MKDLLNFIDASPTAFHAAENVCDILLKNGFTRLEECEQWKLVRGGKYFVTRNSSSCLAFILPEAEYIGLSVCASHTDSPSFMIKSNPELPPVNGIIRLNVEGYGGMARESWFDRPLSAAGRVVTADEKGIRQRLINIDRDLMVIPSLAVHMGKARSEERVNIQTELLPMLSTDEAERHFTEIVAKAAGVCAEAVKGFDLYLYNREKGTVLGAENEFIASARIDNLENVYLSLKAFTGSKKTNMLKIYAAFDNEETGSLTRRGAESTFFADVVERINESENVSRAEYLRRLASSFIMSADNAHAVHPNYAAKADISNRPRLNGGVVMKFSASGRYTTDAVSAALVRAVAQRCGVPIQEYHNRSDITGGSTLGNLMNRYISVNSADIGLAQLAMHSAYETAGARDAEYMERFLTEFYSTEICAAPDGVLKLRKR